MMVPAERQQTRDEGAATAAGGPPAAAAGSDRAVASRADRTTAAGRDRAAAQAAPDAAGKGRVVATAAGRGDAAGDDRGDDHRPGAAGDWGPATRQTPFPSGDAGSTQPLRRVGEAGEAEAGERGSGGAGFRRTREPGWDWDFEGEPAQSRAIRVLIVDDEYPARAELRYRLSQEPGVEITGEAATAREALRLIEALDYDVVFLDIAMPGISGLDLAERLKQQSGAPYVIFTTAYDEYAVKAFEARALDYLLKPYSDERLREALSRVRERLAPAPAAAGRRNGNGGRPGGMGHGEGPGAGPAGGTGAGHGATGSGGGAGGGGGGEAGGVATSAGGSAAGGAAAGASGGGGVGAPAAGSGTAAAGGAGGGRGRSRPRWVMGVRDEAAVPIPVEELVYAEADNDQVFVYTATHRFLTRYTLRELEDLLPPDRFFRCHRGYIVNLRKVREISPFFNGTYNLTVVHAGQAVTIPVARSRVPELKRHFWPEQTG